jgi:hypothetical protein
MRLKFKPLLETNLQGLFAFLSRLSVYAGEVWALPLNETEAVNCLNICL